MEIAPRITVDEKVRFGKPVIQGTRVHAIQEIRNKFGQRVRQGAWDTMAEAKTQLEDFEGRIRKCNGSLPEDLHFHLICEKYDQWAQVNLAPRTRMERFIATRAHLKPFFTCNVREISYEVIEAYKTKRNKDGIAPATMNSELKALSCTLRYAVDCGYLDELPKIRRVKVAKKNPKFLSEEAIWKVLEAATPRTRWPIQLLAFTGIRKGELAHLEWSDVDFDNRLLRVQAKNGWMPKGNEDRTIPLTEGAMQALQALREMNEKRTVKSPLVCPGRKGHLVDIRIGLNDACDRAGIPRIAIHGLRHTFGSQMAMAGANPFAIQKAMGHKDIKTTMIYVDIAKPHIQEQVAKLNKIAIPPPPVKSNITYRSREERERGRGSSRQPEAAALNQ